MLTGQDVDVDHDVQLAGCVDLDGNVELAGCVDLDGDVDLARLVVDLGRLGLPRGCDVLVNCSMGRLGFIPGGAETLLLALRRLIGPQGTVVVPTQTAHNSTTSRYHHAFVDGMTRRQVRRYIAGLPGFHRDSPSFRMGLLAEYVRRQPDAVRSDHPQTSFAALGPSAAAMMAEHRLDSHLGEHSPLAALYRAGAYTLLLGVGYDRCTTLHLAEYRLPEEIPVPAKEYRCFIAHESGRETKVFTALDLDDRQFPALGDELDREPFVRSGTVGRGPARLIPVREAVDYAVGWLARHRRQAAP